MTKPLGQKAYGSIPHLPGSRLGPGDHHCQEGQARICTERLRDTYDRVTVTEKLDGSCVAVAKLDGVIVPLGRAGWPASSSPYEQHQLFHVWAMEHQQDFLDILSEGERLIGEWLAQVHGTRYLLTHAPFVAFDLMCGQRRAVYDEFRSRASGRFPMPNLIHDGPPLSVEAALSKLLPFGRHGALDLVEGAVWRVERKRHFDFLAKYVRPDKVDGFYLPEISGKEHIWNWRPPREHPQI